MDYSPRCNIFDRLISATISDDGDDNLLDYGKSASASLGPIIEPKLEPSSTPNSPDEGSFFLGNVPIKMEPPPICSEQSAPISLFDLPRTRRSRNSKSDVTAKNTPPEKLASIVRRSSRIKPRVESARGNDQFSLVKLNHNDAVVATKTVSSVDDLSLTTQNRNFTLQKLVRHNRKRVQVTRTIIKKSKRRKAVEQVIDQKSGNSSTNIENENVVDKSDEPIKNDEKVPPKDVAPPPPLIVKKPSIILKENTVFTRQNLLPDIKNLSDVLNVWSAKMELQLACGFGMHENLPVDKVIFQAIQRIKNLQNQKSMATETTVSLLKIQKELFTKLMICSGL